jgi:hypothetical protein
MGSFIGFVEANPAGPPQEAVALGTNKSTSASAPRVMAKILRLVFVVLIVFM